MRKYWVGVTVAFALMFMIVIASVNSSADTNASCEDPVIVVVDSPAHWQRYSWTGGPHASDDPPAFPSADWQPNVQGDPHGVGVEGPYFRSNGNSGNGDWFYLEWVEEVTHEEPNPDYPCSTTTSTVVTTTVVPTTVPTTTVPGGPINTENSADCDGVFGAFSDFPDDTNTVTVSSPQGGSVDADFDGSSGDIFVSWADLGVDISTGDAVWYSFVWTGGQSGPFVFWTTDCVTPPTTEPPCEVDCGPGLIPPAYIDKPPLKIVRIELGPVEGLPRSTG